MTTRTLSLRLALGLCLATIGCSAPTDMTTNREEEQPADPNYPSGPYGYVEGSTIDNYKFLGKVPADGNYDGLPLRSLLLGEFHADPAARLLLIEGSASWCYYCNQEAPMVEELSSSHAAVGFRALTILAEGPTRGTPATDTDVSNWVAKHDFKITSMGIDPEARLFQYAPTSAFPVHILVDTRTMAIQWLCVGGLGGCDTEGAVSDAIAGL